MPENDADSQQRPVDEAEMARQRGRPLLAALEERLPAATERAEVAAQLASAMVVGLDLPDAEGALIVETARIQDVGKLYIAAELLQRPLRALDQRQLLALGEHYEHGRALALGAGIPQRACNWVLHARERWDGSGPGGLTAEEIPLASRLVAVTREYLDAPLLTADVSEQTAQAVGIRHVREEAGVALDPELAELAAAMAEPRSAP